MVRMVSMPGDAPESSVASREGEVEPRPGVLGGFWQEDVSRLGVFCDRSFVAFGASRKRRKNVPAPASICFRLPKPLCL